VSQVTAALPVAVGFFGKIPRERDFVRVNVGAFLRAGLDRWFQEGVEHLRGERTRLPAEPAGFLLSPAAGRPLFVGVFAPGEDALGRVFPAVVFAALDQPPEISLLPLQLASFYEAGTRLASAAHGFTAGQVVAEIGALAAGLRPAVRALDSHALLVRSSGSDLRAAVGGTAEAAAYALTTLVAACAQARHSPARVLVLDCPAPTDELRTFWLELVCRRLGDAGPMPSFLGTRDSGRLLVALGPAPSLMLAYLADPDHKGSRRWPLRPLDPKAGVNALQTLPGPERQALASGTASLADVLQLFAQV
jgi:type VI secretion system ImpM family protein